LCLTCDRKDGDILQNLANFYNIIFTEDILTDNSYKKIYPNIQNHNVIEFLIQMKMFTTSDYFIGYESSTVSNYIQYLRYINNKTCNLYSVNNIKYNNSYTWNINNIRGPSISWKIFYKDNISV
jgi:hypothetical protein